MLESVIPVLFLFLLLWIFGSAGWAGLRAAPWLPTRQGDVRRLLTIAHVQPGETVVDLGAGDGRVLIAAARDFGARAIGYEVSLLPYLVASLRRILSPNRRLVSVRYVDLFHADLSTADVVICFLTPMGMQRLKTKFVRQLKPGARVISYTFPVVGWQPLERDQPNPNLMPIYHYVWPGPPGVR